MGSLRNLQNQFEVALKQLTLPSAPKELYEPIDYTLQLGGKRMRPLLVLLGCKLFSDDISEALKPAIGIELFHNFTLLHDDIMDDAPVRRGEPAVHKKWDSNIAILSGDAMMVKAYQNVVQTHSDALKPVLEIFNRTALEVCEGQQLDMNFEVRKDVTIEEYIEMIRLKTAVLLAASLQIGAIIGGASEEQAALLYNFGLNSGIAFQLQDDILDVYGESHKVGKQKGGDIIANKKTYLLLKAEELASAEVASSLKNWLDDQHQDSEKVQGVTDIYNQLGVKEFAEARMWEYFNLATESLKTVNGNAEWKKVLLDFSTQLMHRES